MKETKREGEEEALAALFGGEASRGGARRKALWVAGGVALAGALLWLVLRSGGPPAGPRYETAKVTRGDLVVKVSATGNLQPTNNVEVGSELSGIVAQVLVEENDVVKKGQVLARLDLSKLEDAVNMAKASVAVAEAQVLQAEATVREAQGRLARLQQLATLSSGKAASPSELEAAAADRERAEANAVSARANVSQVRARLRSDETNLGKASIRSPIDGVVLVRSVDPGQTVAATLQAPVLFTLCEDLAKMELEVSVDEADVGQVRVGQKATFSVDAWPSREYTGVITRVGFGAQVKDGVISYPAVIAVANDDLSLRPGMTGTAEIVTVTRAGALLLPNAALRFSPEQVAASPPAKGGGVVGKLMPRPPFRRQKGKVEGATQPARPRLFVPDGSGIKPIEVAIGVSDGQRTELLEGPLRAGDEVVVGVASARP